jgi:hypothetical protein
MRIIIFLQNTHLNDSIRNEKVISRIAEIDTRYKQDTAVMKQNYVFIFVCKKQMTVYFCDRLLLFWLRTN